MMEVRCCCDAGKLIGWLPDLRRAYERFVRFDIVTAERELKTIALEIADIHTSADPEGHLAYKSRDYPIEWLRTIEGFVEANEYEVALGKNQPVDVNPGRCLFGGRPSARQSALQSISSPPGVQSGQHNLDSRGVRK